MRITSDEKGRRNAVWPVKERVGSGQAGRAPGKTSKRPAVPDAMTAIGDIKPKCTCCWIWRYRGWTDRRQIAVGRRGLRMQAHTCELKKDAGEGRIWRWGAASRRAPVCFIGRLKRGQML